MSVFCECYRAADRAAAIVQPDRSRVIDDPEYGVAGFDAVETGASTSLSPGRSAAWSG